ncbi:hypothetical protein OY671_009601, partial [Metschnikowia pulcherrima]
MQGKVRSRWFPKVTLTVSPPRRFAIEGDMTARQRRAIAGRRLYDEMSAMMFATSDTGRTSFSASAEARAIHGGKASVVEDVKREPSSYDRLFAATTVSGKRLAEGTTQGEAVGSLSPNVNGVVAAFFASQSIVRVPAMLNFTVGVSNMRSACMTAAIRTVVTARAFVDQAKLHDVIAALQADGSRVIWLEDLGDTI